MSYQVVITFISVLFIYFNYVNSSGISRKTVSALNDKHLVTAVAQIPISAKLTRNATGHIVEMEGVSPLILEWLSRRFKFQYTVFNVNTSNVEDGGPNLPGLLSYLLKGECDTIMSAIFPTMERISSLNFVHPWTYTPTCVLIPKPGVSDNNVDALTKPFQIWVWMVLIISIMAVNLALWCFNKSQQSSVSKFNNISMYILGTLLNQGGYVSNKSTTIRLVIGGWCLLLLVLLNTYNGTLISYVTAIRTDQPLVNSIEDILKNPSVNLVVDKGKAPDVLFSTAVKGIYKELGDKLRSFPNSRCNSSLECIDMVKSLPPRHVFVNAQAALKFIVREEYLRTKKCQLSIVDGGKGFSSRPLSWVLAKRSPYVQEFNLGFSMLHDAGLINFWEQKILVTRPCYNEKKTNDGRRANTKKLVRLTLGNLAGAFVLLAIGFLLSFIVFVLEIIVHRTVF